MVAENKTPNIENVIIHVLLDTGSALLKPLYQRVRVDIHLSLSESKEKIRSYTDEQGKDQA